MKSGEFREFLVDAQKFKGDESGRRLGQLAQIFEVLPEKTVADVTKRLGNLRPPAASFLSTQLRTLRESVSSLRRLMAGRAKASLLKDIQLLELLIEHHANVAIDTFVSTAMEALASAPARPTKVKKTVRADL